MAARGGVGDKAAGEGVTAVLFDGGGEGEEFVGVSLRRATLLTMNLPW